MLQYRLIIFKIQFPKKQTLIEACAAADGAFYVFQQQQYWLDIYTEKTMFSVIVAPPGIQRTIWRTIFGSGRTLNFHNLIKEFQARCV